MLLTLKNVILKKKKTVFSQNNRIFRIIILFSRNKAKAMNQFHDALLSNFCLTKLEIFDDGIKVKRVDRYANPHSLEEAVVKAGWNKRGKMNGRANIAAISAVCEWEERARRKKGREAKVVIAECRRVWRSERNERGGRTVRWLMADFASLYRGCPFVPAFRETAARRARGSDQRSHGINLLFSCPTILPFSSPVPPRSPLGDNWPAYKNIPPKSRWHTISMVPEVIEYSFTTRNILKYPRFLRLRCLRFIDEIGDW